MNSPRLFSLFTNLVNLTALPLPTHPYLQLSLPLLDYFRRTLWIWFLSVSVIAVFLNANISSTWALLITWSFSWIYSLPPLFLLPPWNASHNFPYPSSLNDCGSASEVARILRKDGKANCHPPDLSLSLAMYWFSGLLTRMNFLKAGPMCSLPQSFCICNVFPA